MTKKSLTDEMNKDKNLVEKMAKNLSDPTIDGYNFENDPTLDAQTKESLRDHFANRYEDWKPGI